MLRTQDGWIEEYRKKGALWIHDGNQKRPHALLTSGKHSNGFFNSRLVIPDEVLLRDAVADLLEQFGEEGGDFTEIESVVGPQTGATRLAELISDQLNAYARDDVTFWASPAKNEQGGKKLMVFGDDDRRLVRGQYVLLCEDVLTTGGSVDLAVDAVEEVGGSVMPFVLVLVNRSGLTEVSGRQVVALIDRPMPMWTPLECPLCKQGSEAVRPKDNWDRLNESY